MRAQVAIGALDTPIGRLWMACSAQGVCKLVFPGEGAQAQIDRWLAVHKPTQAMAPAHTLLERTGAELGEYFAGTRRIFTLPLDFQGSAFHQRVWRALTQIPYGHTISYGKLAHRLEAPKAARAVGAACGTNPVPIVAPCHRVLGSDGSLHGFGGGLPVKAWLLRHEGVLLDL